MADRAADELRQKVLSGELVPGQRLVQDDLASALGVSVTPVREALFRLANEGLIHAERNRSFTVASNTDDDLRDMFWIHGTIASELASRACLHATDELVAELTELHKEYLRVLNDPEARFDVSWNFFRVFYRAAQSPRLLVGLRSALETFPDITSSAPGGPELTSRTQKELLRALAKRDCERTRALSMKMAQQAGELYIASLRS